MLNHLSATPHASKHTFPSVARHSNDPNVEQSITIKIQKQSD